MGRGAWQSTIHMVTKNQTQLKQLSTDAHKERENDFVLLFVFIVLNNIAKSKKTHQTRDVNACGV